MPKHFKSNHLYTAPFVDLCFNQFPIHKIKLSLGTRPRLSEASNKYAMQFTNQMLTVFTKTHTGTKPFGKVRCKFKTPKAKYTILSNTYTNTHKSIRMPYKESSQRMYLYKYIHKSTHTLTHYQSYRTQLRNGKRK